MRSLPLHLMLGPSLGLILYLSLAANGVSQPAAITAAITLLTAWWWATEAIPIPATSLVPFVTLPLFGVVTHKEAASGMGSHIILLMLGGFIMAKALENSQAHRRFALYILRLIGNEGENGNKRLVLAFMLAAAFLSMWISNTATCLMLIPIVLACLQQLNNEDMAVPLVISVAYACSIGGIATLIGTPPNVIFAGIYEEVVGVEFGFLEWMRIGLPLVVILLPIAWLWLTRNVRGRAETSLPAIGAWSADEKRVVAIFSLIVMMWIFRSQPFGGWTGLVGLTTVGDSTIALFGALLMFVVRSEKQGGLLDWNTAVDIPWGILLMYGAGITIAKAFFASGLADLIGAGLSDFVIGLPLYLVILTVCLAITFFTELNSNLATTTLVLPILATTAISADLDPALLMIPATISASCAFMLPVATAPNAIAYSTGKVTVNVMLREGVRLNLLFALVISSYCYFVL